MKEALEKLMAQGGLGYLQDFSMAVVTELLRYKFVKVVSAQNGNLQITDFGIRNLKYARRIGMAQIKTAWVTKWAITARKIKILADEHKQLREAILHGLLNGASIPLDGPYVVDLSQNGGKDFDWEDEYAKLRIKQFMAEGYTKVEATALVAQEMKEMKEKAPDKESVVIGGQSYVGGVKLTPKVNAKYKGRAA
jgi:uncharacterized protein YoaH (UPF0181 family)